MPDRRLDLWIHLVQRTVPWWEFHKQLPGHCLACAIIGDELQNPGPGKEKTHRLISDDSSSRRIFIYPTNS